MLLLLILTGLWGVKTDKEIRIIYTNDINGALESSKAYWVSKEMPPDLGNAKSLEVFVNRERKSNDILLINSGNLASLPTSGDKKNPEELARFLSDLHYDASLIGTNELSFGKEFLKELLAKSSTPFLSANLKGSQKGFIITSKNNIKIGIFGITSPYAHLFVPGRYRKEMEFAVDIEEATKRSVKELQSGGAEIIIGLSDAGFTRDSTLAESVDGIDCIIGASNRGWTLREPYETPTRHTLFCKGYTNLSSAGRLVLYLDENNNIAGYDHMLITLYVEEYPPYK